DDPLAGYEPPDAMNDAYAQYRPPRLGLCDMGGNLTLGKTGIVIEHHRLHPVIGAHETDEGRDRPDISRRSLERGDFGPGVEVFTLDPDLAHPPVTGGKKATSSLGPTRASKRACA